MMKIKNVVILCGALFYAEHGSADIFDLEKGIAVNDDNIYEIAGTSVEYARARRSQLSKGDDGVAAFYRISGTPHLLSLSYGVNLYLTDIEGKTLLSYWPLTRWPYLQRVPEILHDHDQVGVKEWKERIEYTAHMPYAGCLNQHPVRYGDIEDDGASDIVLVLNGELIVFSPRYQRTVFSAFVEASDWYRESMEGMTLESDLVDGESYQYLSEHLLYNGYNHKAHRSYTKLYIGDYDEDGNSDILTWQKIYASNKVNEAQGFHLIRNEFKHHERDLKAQETTKQGITGEYLPQATDQATIRQWLATNKLTWQKGFPSVSECAGEAGNLIPEMHDPLLNDPEVLQQAD